MSSMSRRAQTSSNLWLWPLVTMSGSLPSQEKGGSPRVEVEGTL